MGVTSIDLIFPRRTSRPSLVTGTHSFSSSFLGPRRPRPRPLPPLSPPRPRPPNPPRVGPAAGAGAGASAIEFNTMSGEFGDLELTTTTLNRGGDTYCDC